MTKKEFKSAMLRGLGRCVKAVRENPEKYRDIVLWACQRDTAFDAQSEGTRSWYVYTMVSAYPDPETFIRTAAEALKKYRSGSGWNALYLGELLMFFAMDGYIAAHRAVEKKYREILAAIHRHRCRPSPFHELFDLEQLGLVLAVDAPSFLQIAGDYGRLYREKPFMSGGDFAWFFATKGARYKRSMERAAQQDENIACFLRSERSQEEIRRQQRASNPEQLTGARLSRWLNTHADRNTLAQYALAYREQNQPQPRAEALAAFSHCPYPDDPLPIMEDAQSSCEALQKAAWGALENLRHPAVRRFALDNAEHGIRTPENFAILVTNYAPEDSTLLEALLRERIAAKDWDGVHVAGMDIYRTFNKGSTIPHPRHLLPLLYEYTPCSFCRETAVCHMSRHRLLTKEILEECLYDSNDEIRRYAQKRLNK